MTTQTRRLVILAEGALDFHHGKTAVSLLRYRPDDVIAVIDADHAGRTTDEVLGFGQAIAIVASVEEVLDRQPTDLVIGIAPTGGALPESWKRQLITSLNAGISVVSGLHTMLNDDPELVAAARAGGATISDVRRPPEGLEVARMRPWRPGVRVITFVGSDCAVGKMTAALELHAAASELGLRSAFVATGQTGIMLAGDGIAVDRVIGDFMAGSIEELVAGAEEAADWVFVEGQGSLFHPAYSGVTLSLLHGSHPDAMILVHIPGQETIDEYPVPIPPLPRVIEAYEQAAAWVRPARVVAVALNTRHLSETDARAAIAATRRETGLPVDDPVRFGSRELMASIRDVLS